MKETWRRGLAQSSKWLPGAAPESSSFVCRMVASDPTGTRTQDQPCDCAQVSPGIPKSQTPGVPSVGCGPHRGHENGARREQPRSRLSLTCPKVAAGDGPGRVDLCPTRLSPHVGIRNPPSWRPLRNNSTDSLEQSDRKGRSLPQEHVGTGLDRVGCRPGHLGTEAKSKADTRLSPCQAGCRAQEQKT
jgi:hypothetical protein